MRDGVACYIGNGVVVDPQHLLGEIERLEAMGLDVRSRLLISESCPLILPFHVAVDKAREALRESSGAGKIGTTGKGIGPAYEDKVARRALRVQDLKHPERFAKKLRELLDAAQLRARGLPARRGARVRADLRDGDAGRRRAAADDRRRRLHALQRQPRRRQHPLRRRAGHAARHRPRHLSVRHLEQLRRRQRGRRRRRRARTCCTTSSASPRPTPRGSAAARSRPSCRSTSRASIGHHLSTRRPGARHRHRPGAALRLARRGAAQALDHHQRHLGPVHHQARRPRRPDEIKVCVGYELRGQRIDILPLDADDIAACVPIYDSFPGWTREHLRRDATGTRCRSTRAATSSASRASSARRSTWSRPAPTATTRSCCATRTSPMPRRAGAPPADALLHRRGRMLTDDGKHLYVSWDEYHMLIERLALKIHASGWEFDQILCLARGGMRPGDVLSRVFDKPLGDHVDQLVPRRGRHDPGPARHGQVHHPAARASSRAACCWSTTSPIPASRLRAVVDRLRGMPSISELRSAVIWTKGVSTVHARLLRRAAAHEPVDPPAVRGVRRPAAGRAGEEIPDLNASATETGPAKAGPLLLFTFWCPGRDSNPHGVTR